MKVAVVIVNYRTPGLVTKCLETLQSEIGSDLTIRAIVGDAQSGDGSVETVNDFIKANGLDWASCFDIGCNRGFAYGNNWVVRSHVLPDPSFDFVYFLNPDTYVHPQALLSLARFLTTHPEAGVAGSRLENPDGSFRSYAFRFPAPWREFFRGARLSLFDRLVPSSKVSIAGLAHTAEVDWVTGASFMMPRAVLEKVGLMDEGYFLYFEETDLMARVRKAGYSVWHVAESRVVHLAGQSTGQRSENAATKPVSTFWLHSRCKFLHDHYGWVGLVLANTLFLAGDLVYKLHRTVRRQSIADPRNLWRDYLVHGFRQPPPLP